MVHNKRCTFNSFRCCCLFLCLLACVLQVFQMLKTAFGPNMTSHLIVMVAGRDQLEKRGADFENQVLYYHLTVKRMQLYTYLKKID